MVKCQRPCTYRHIRAAERSPFDTPPTNDNEPAPKERARHIEFSNLPGNLATVATAATAAVRYRFDLRPGCDSRLFPPGRPGSWSGSTCTP